MDLPQKLRAETAPAHRAVEKVVDFESMLGSRERVVRLLHCFHGFVAPLERQLAAVLPKAVLAGRAKTRLIVADLEALGERVPTDSAVAWPWAAELCPTPPAAMGVLYVLEGSTLGGHVMTKALRRTAFWPASGLRYFDPYGARTGEMWQAFCQSLRQFTAPGEEEAVVGAANGAFAALLGQMHPPGRAHP